MIRRDLGLTATRTQQPEPDSHRDVADVASRPYQEPHPVTPLHHSRDATHAERSTNGVTATPSYPSSLSACHHEVFNPGSKFE